MYYRKHFLLRNCYVIATLTFKHGLRVQVCVTLFPQARTLININRYGVEVLLPIVPGS